MIFFITKARKVENTKEKKNFVLSYFRVFVMNPFSFRLVRVMTLII
jgi:hypothetical protein